MIRQRGQLSIYALGETSIFGQCRIVIRGSSLHEEIPTDALTDGLHPRSAEAAEDPVGAATEVRRARWRAVEHLRRNHALKHPSTMGRMPTGLLARLHNCRDLVSTCSYFIAFAISARRWRSLRRPTTKLETFPSRPMMRTGMASIE